MPFVRQDGFTPRQVGRLAGVKYDTLDYWATTGFLRPTLVPAAGTGSVRRYSFADVVAARVARDLREQGVSLQALRRVVSELRRLKGLERQPLSAAKLVVCGRDVLVLHSDDELVSALRAPGQAAMRLVYDLGPAVRDMRQAIVKVRAA